MNKKIEKKIEAFDKKFGWTNESLEIWLREALTSLLTDERERVVKLLEGMKDIGETCVENDDWKKGHKYALDEAIKLYQQDDIR